MAHAASAAAALRIRANLACGCIDYKIEPCLQGSHFKFPRISKLTNEQAARTLVEPVRERGVSLDGDAVGAMVEYTQGYPDFIQEYGNVLWGHGLAAFTVPQFDRFMRRSRAFGAAA